RPPHRSLWDRRGMSLPNALDDPTATRIASGDLEAVFLPGHGMLAISLRHRGIEYLRRNEELKIFAKKNRTAGIPFLFPWANRLAGLHYEVAGRGVTLSPHSPRLRYVDNGLPMPGMMWPRLAGGIVEAAPNRLTAAFDWSHPQGLV